MIKKKAWFFFFCLEKKKEKGMNLWCCSSLVFGQASNLDASLAHGVPTPKCLQVEHVLFFSCLFFTPFTPSLFFGRLECSVPFLFVSSVVPLTCIVHIIMDGVSAVWPQAGGGSHPRRHRELLLSGSFQPKRSRSVLQVLQSTHVPLHLKSLSPLMHAEVMCATWYLSRQHYWQLFFFSFSFL